MASDRIRELATKAAHDRHNYALTHSYIGGDAHDWHRGQFDDADGSCPDPDCALVRASGEPLPAPPTDLHDSLHSLLTRYGLASRTEHLGLFTEIVQWAADACRQTKSQAVAERIEDVREHLDKCFSLCGGNRELRGHLDRVDATLRQVKRDLGYPNAGLGRYPRVGEPLPAVPAQPRLLATKEAERWMLADAFIEHVREFGPHSRQFIFDTLTELARREAVAAAVSAEPRAPEAAQPYKCHIKNCDCAGAFHPPVAAQPAPLGSQPQEWRDIATAPNRYVIVGHETSDWVPCVGVQDSTGYWLDSRTKARLIPQPTKWREIPDRPATPAVVSEGTPQYGKPWELQHLEVNVADAVTCFLRWQSGEPDRLDDLKSSMQDLQESFRRYIKAFPVRATALPDGPRPRERESVKIQLRTLCGCERTIEVPMKWPPDRWVVPYRRADHEHIFPADGETCLTSTFLDRRTFEYSGRSGLYGYPLYVEILDGPRAHPQEKP